VITRRRFLERSSWAAGALALKRNRLMPALAQPETHHPPLTAAAALDPNTLARFVDPLPFPPIAQPDGFRAAPADPQRKAAYYRMAMRASEAKFHRDLPATRVWTFGSSAPGPTLEARSGDGVWVEWANELPDEHFLPIDHHLHGAEADQPPVRTAIHLHGAKVPPESDGYPEDWFVPGKSRLYYYPNQQDAAMLWYHDHAMGINRLNIYAGLLGTFFIRDAVEDSLPLPRGTAEIPLVLYDRMLTREGQLLYPVSDKPHAPWVPEVFGDAILVNGKLFPYLEVEPRKYRLRLLNASNGRFYHLSFSSGLAFHQIGTDQGLLQAPVPLASLALAPAERADLIVDFSTARGEQVVLKNDAGGVMQFRVSGNPAEDPSSLPAVLRSVPRIPEAEAVRTRLLTLDEYDNGVAEPILMLLNASHWKMPITEKPILNSTEIWTFINPTDDSHPIHLHLVRFQILDRQRYEPWTYQTTGKLKFSGAAVPAEPNEAGWKDTVRADPRMVTRIIVRFEGFPGRYVWHCHILEHEDNEMMRPYEVIAAPERPS
jgi:spore coat protein A